MSIQNLLLLIVFSVVVIGGGWYYFDSTREAEDTNSKVEEMNEDQSESTSGREDKMSGLESFSYLQSLRDDLVCNISYSSPETKATVDGTVYLDKAGRIAGDFTMEQGGQTFVSHMIETDATLHTWTESSFGNVAIKYDLTNADSPTGDNGANDNLPVSMNQDVTYDCKEWSVDESKFTPPESVDFMDPESLMQKYGVPEMQ